MAASASRACGSLTTQQPASLSSFLLKVFLVRRVTKCFHRGWLEALVASHLSLIRSVRAVDGDYAPDRDALLEIGSFGGIRLTIEPQKLGSRWSARLRTRAQSNTGLREVMPR
jgi:hypothetical protein